MRMCDYTVGFPISNSGLDTLGVMEEAVCVRVGEGARLFLTHTHPLHINT